MRAAARGKAYARIPGMQESADRTAGEIGSGWDGLRAGGQTVTVHRLRFHPAIADMQQRRLTSYS